MNRNFPKLLSLYLKGLPKHSIRAEHNESHLVTQETNRISQGDINTLENSIDVQIFFIH